MGRYRGPRVRLMRREGVNLDLKKRWTLERRESPPGQHGLRKTKLSNYGIQLREKQKAKRFYGILEKQFRNYFIKAASTKGVTGTILLQLLERRLDNVLYQMGFATTRAQGRQMATHGLILLNGKKVDIPSIQVKPEDVITFKNKPATVKLVQTNLELNKGWAAPAWLEVSNDKLTGKVLRFPTRDEIKAPVAEQLIVELYSR
jgi:small subunit ribosomal protein S4